MKAAVLYETRQPLVVEAGIALPELRAGQILVKIAYSGLCRSQLMEVRGLRGKDRYLPHLLGHEGVARVVETGKGVTKVARDEYVILTWIKGEGQDAGGVQYKLGDQVINGGAVTTFNEYAVVSENRCVKLPEGVPLETAPLLGCAIPTGTGMIVNELGFSHGDTIAIFGVGGIGMSALLATNLYDTPLTIVVDVNEHKLALAEEFGATHIINALQEDPVERINDITNGAGVDFSVEAAGTTRTIEQAFQAVRVNGGLCVFASHPGSNETISLDPHDLIRGKNIRGTWGGKAQPDRDIPLFASLYEKNKLPLQKLLSTPYSLDEINLALNDLEENRILRALIEVDQDI